MSKIIKGLEVNAFLDDKLKMITGFKEYSIINAGKELCLAMKSGEYPEGAVPPNDYGRRVAVLDSRGNNLTGFKYSNAGDTTDSFQVVNKDYYYSAGLVNRYGKEVLPTVFNDIILTNEGYAIVTVNDPETGENARVGYFKIPESFSEAKGARPITVYLNGIELYFETEPVIKNQRTMVPMRKIFEVMGAKVEWNNSSKKVTAISEDKRIILTIGSKTAFVNDEKIELDESPFIQGDKTLVPLRFVSENLDADVKWDNDLRRVIITSN